MTTRVSLWSSLMSSVLDFIDAEQYIGLPIHVAFPQRLHWMRLHILRRVFYQYCSDQTNHSSNTCYLYHVICDV